MSTKTTVSADAFLASPVPEGLAAGTNLTFSQGTVQPLPSPSIVAGQQGVVIFTGQFSLFDNGFSIKARVRASVTVPPGDDKLIGAYLESKSSAVRGSVIEVDTFTAVDVVVGVKENAPAKTYTVTVKGQLVDDTEFETPGFKIDFPVEAAPVAAQVTLSVKPSTQEAKAGEPATYKVKLKRNKAANVIGIKLIQLNKIELLQPTFDPPVVFGDESKLTVIAPSGASSQEIQFKIGGLASEEDKKVDVTGVKAMLKIKK